LAGTGNEQVSREFTRLKKEKIIIPQGKRITVPDISKLKEIAIKS